MVFLRKLLKVPLLFRGTLTRERRPGIFFLIYHRVGNTSSFEMDIPIPIFSKQMEHLAETNCVIPYDDAVTCLLSGTAIDRDLFVITFDDGFEDFYHKAFPVLRDLGLPAILFVTTGFVDERVPYPLQASSREKAAPVSWDMINEMRASGFVAIGAHTHTHRELTREPAETIRKELSLSNELFRDRIGFVPRHFAYPRALWSEQAESVIRELYDSAVVGGGKKAFPDRFNPLRIPRVPVRRSDGWIFFLAKLKGYLFSEEAFYEPWRKFRRARAALE